MVHLHQRSALARLRRRAQSRWSGFRRLWTRSPRHGCGEDNSACAQHGRAAPDAADQDPQGGPIPLAYGVSANVDRRRDLIREFRDSTLQGLRRQPARASGQQPVLLTAPRALRVSANRFSDASPDTSLRSRRSHLTDPIITAACVGASVQLSVAARSHASTVSPVIGSATATCTADFAVNGTATWATI